MQTFEEVKNAVDEFVVSLGKRSSYTLERVSELLDKLDNPHEKFKTVHIAGTSGKTSTAYYTAGMLQAAGYKTGLSVSPYLVELNERVQMGTEPIAEDLFCREFTEFFKIVNTLSIKPTYFELFVSFAYWYFAKAKVEYAVIEVGLGGMLDATNVISRPDKVCIITDIGLDHISILGDTLEEIAAQKAGIIQDHNHTFMYPQGPQVDNAIAARAEEKHAVLHHAEAKPVDRDLPGFQKRNWNLARTACEYILDRDEHTPKNSDWALKATEVTIPGRLELFEYRGKTIALDGAHNPQKIHSLVKSFKAKFAGSSAAVLLAIGDNKNAHLKDIAKEIDSLQSFVIVTTFKKGRDMPRLSIDPKDIAEELPKSETLIKPELEEGLKALLDRKEDVLLVTGSLYLVGAVRKLLEERL